MRKVKGMNIEWLELVRHVNNFVALSERNKRKENTVVKPEER